jgi:hypothetical protein
MPWKISNLSTCGAMLLLLAAAPLFLPPAAAQLGTHFRTAKASNSGSVTLLAAFCSSGRDCQRVRYVVKPASGAATTADTNTYVLINCRLADGSWKLDSSAKPDAS